MNREDIIRMGQEVYLCDNEGRDDNSIIIVGHLERFAELVASAEREAILAVIGDNQCECRCSEVVRDRGQA